MNAVQKTFTNNLRCNISRKTVFTLDTLLEHFEIPTTGTLNNRAASLIRELYFVHQDEIQITKLEALVNPTPH